MTFRDETTGAELAGEVEAMPARWSVEMTETGYAGLLRAPQTPHEAAAGFVAHCRDHGMLGEFRACGHAGSRRHCGLYGIYLEWCEIERRPPVAARLLFGALPDLPGVSSRQIESRTADGKRYRPTVINIDAEPVKIVRRRKAA